MTPNPSISQQLERHSVLTMESTIPAEMTVEQWRRLRAERRRSTTQLPLRQAPCDHLNDTTTRYDQEQRQLSFLQVCHACGTEKLVETIPYEPHFKPHGAVETEGATVHELPVRRDSEPARRAA